MLKKYHIPVREDWIVEGGFDRDSGYDGFTKLYQQGDYPEVIFTANDRIAQGAYKAIRELRLHIPQDVGVIALGHSEFAELLFPSLTISDSPPDLIGKTAMDLLEKEINQGDAHHAQRVLLDTRLVINGSILLREK